MTLMDTHALFTFTYATIPEKGTRIYTETQKGVKGYALSHVLFVYTTLVC